MIDSITLVISKLCNLNCFFCLSNSGPLTTVGETTAEELLQFFDRLPGLSFVKITGGEPFMSREKTRAVVEYLTGRGINVQINTNGTGDLDILKGLPPELIEFQVSLDGLKEKHDSIRGEGVFDKAVAFIRQAKVLGHAVGVMSVIPDTEPDLVELRKFAEFVISLGAFPSVQVMTKVGRATDVETNYKNFDEAVEMMRGLGEMNVRQHVTYCETHLCNGSGTIAIDEQGYVIPCPILASFRVCHMSEFNEFQARYKMKRLLQGRTCGSYQTEE